MIPVVGAWNISKKANLASKVQVLLLLLVRKECMGGSFGSEDDLQ